MDFKICNGPNCIHNRKPQPISNFYKNKSTTDGLQFYCKDCIKEQRLKAYDEKKDQILLQKKVFYSKNKKQILENKKLYNNKNALYLTYYNKLSKYEECRQDPNNPELLQVKCKNNNCGEWFNPTNLQVKNRLQSIYGNTEGDNNLYCSNFCKKTCPIYRKQTTSNNNICKSHLRTNILQSELREIVLEVDNFTCQKCGKSKEEFPDLILECHHIIPISKEIIYASDIVNCITLCEKCHSNVHIGDCSYKSLAYN